MDEDEIIDQAGELDKHAANVEVAPETDTEGRESEDDALARILGGEEEDGEETFFQDIDGEEEAAEAEDDFEDDDEETEDAQPTAAAPQESQPSEQAAYDEALARVSMMRPNASFEELLKIPRGALIAMARMAPGQTEQPKAEDAPSAQPQQQDPLAGVDLDAFAEALKGELDGDVSQTLVTIIKGLVASRDNQATLDRVSSLQQAVLSMGEASARDQLKDQYPGLSDADTFSAVQQQMRVLAQTGAYTEIAPLMEAAARLLDLPKAASKGRVSREKKRRGQITPPGRKAKRKSAKPTAEDVEDEALRRILNPTYDGNALKLRERLRRKA